MNDNLQSIRNDEEKQTVADDYTSMLYKGIAKTQDSISKIISDLLKKKDSAVDLALSTCLLANVTICDASNKTSSWWPSRIHCPRLSLITCVSQ
jgi:hypothetical protein